MSTKRESVSAVVFTKNRDSLVLILRRDVPVWVLPGGGIDPGESPEEAICREVLEETGLHVTITRKVAEYTPLNRFTKFTHFYECAIQSGEITTGPETRAIDYFSPNDLPKKIPPPYPDWIKDTLTYTHLIKKNISSVTLFVVLKSAITHPILFFRFILARFGKPINS